jgi:hypothetical protein
MVDYGTYLYGNTYVGRDWHTVSGFLVPNETGILSFYWEKGSDALTLTSPEGTWTVYRDPRSENFNLWSFVLDAPFSEGGHPHPALGLSGSIALTLPSVLSTTQPTTSTTTSAPSSQAVADDILKFIGDGEDGFIATAKENAAIPEHVFNVYTTLYNMIPEEDVTAEQCKEGFRIWTEAFEANDWTTGPSEEHPDTTRALFGGLRPTEWFGLVIDNIETWKARIPLFFTFLRTISEAGVSFGVISFVYRGYFWALHVNRDPQDI